MSSKKGHDIPVENVAPPMWTIEYNESVPDRSADPSVTSYKPTGIFKADFLEYCKFLHITPHPRVVPKNNDSNNGEHYDMQCDPLVSIRGWQVSMGTLNSIRLSLNMSKTITILDLFNTGLTQDHLDILLKILFAPPTNPSSIATLKLEHNPLRNDGTGDPSAIFSEFCREGSSLQHLALRGNAISDATAAALSAQLRDNVRLTALNLSDNLVGDTGAIALLSVLRFHPGVRSFSLGGNRVTDAGAEVAASLFTRYPVCDADVEARQSLQQRIMVFNKLVADTNKKRKKGAKGDVELMEELADLLPLEQPTTPDAKPRCPANRVLRQLNLGRNPIGREGAQMLATALKGDPEGPTLHSMQRLYLGRLAGVNDRTIRDMFAGVPEELELVTV